MKLGIVGSRRRNSPEDKELIKQKILELKPDELVSGGCKKGADHFAEELSKELHIPIKIFYPKLEEEMPYLMRVQEYYCRNEQIANYSDKLIVAVARDRKGGAENTIKHFIKSGREKELILL